MRLKSMAWLVCLWAGFAIQAGQLPDPPGGFLPFKSADAVQAKTWGPGDRIVGTYYFYWYKWDNNCAADLSCDPAYCRAHIEFATGHNGSSKPVDALTDHPVDLQKWNYEDPKWHYVQVEEMMKAGIDLILPVFWGVPGRYGKGGHQIAASSALGLAALVQALEEREKYGKPNPRIAMFYDTSTLTYESPFNLKQGNKIDLTAEAGKDHFYSTVRDFYSLVPVKYWGMWENHPLVWLYAAEYSSGSDNSLFPHVKVEFSKAFGGFEPMFVAHSDWSQACGADWVTQWGAAAIKPTYLSVNSVGPGFDNSGAFGKARGSHVLIDRKDGEYYRNSWELALRSSAPFTIIESWNELHEGTQICPTVEYGDEYIKLTRQFADLFKKPSGVQPLPGPYLGEKSVAWTGKGEAGIAPVESADGKFRKVETADGEVLEVESGYLYFRVDDSFTFGQKAPMTLEAEYFSLPTKPGAAFGADGGAWHVEYDSWDYSANYYGMYKATETVAIDRRIGWKTARFELADARLANNQNQCADFRISAPRGLRFKSLKITR